MKRRFLAPTVLLALFASACSFSVNIGDSESLSETIESTDTSTSSDSGSSSSETSSESGSSSSSGSTSEGGIQDGKLLLGAYGDYVELENGVKNDSELQSKYDDLTSKVKSDAVGILQSEYQKGAIEFFNINNKITFKINISRSQLELLNNDFDRNNHETYRQCSLDITFVGLHFHYEGVGIRQKGNTSRGPILDGNRINLRHYKISFKETFDDEFCETPMVWDDEEAKLFRDDRKFFGLNKIDIRWNRNQDATYLKEYYANEFFRKNGAMSAKTNLINYQMNVDGQLQNMGIYLAVETFNNSWIKRNFVKSYRSGDLYKCSYGSGVGAKFDSVDPSLYGIDVQHGSRDGNCYEELHTYCLKTNEDTSDHSSLTGFITDLIDQHGDTIYDFMNTRSNYNLWINYLACSYLVGDVDDLRGNYNNTYIYFTGDNSHQFMAIPTDLDRSFGLCGDGGNPTGSLGAAVLPFDRRTGYIENYDKLINVNLLSSNSAKVRQDYLDRISEILNNDTFTYSSFTALFEKVQANYSSCLQLGEAVNGYTPQMTLDASTNLSGFDNLKMETYLATKRQTFLSYINS